MAVGVMVGVQVRAQQELNKMNAGGGDESLKDAFKQFRARKLEERKKRVAMERKAKDMRRGIANATGAAESPTNNAESFKRHLRQKFIEAARTYIGVPYGRRFHEENGECKCDGCSESGRQLYNDPKFLDCCALVRKCVYDLREDFGFELGGGNQAYQFDTLPNRVSSVDELEPGDLIFYSGEYLSEKAKKQPHDMTHVEIFVGGKTGKGVIGSREKQKWIKEYDTYEFVAKSWKLKEHFFVKIDNWLNGELKSYCKEHAWTKHTQRGNNAVHNEKSVFFADAEEASSN